MKKRIRPLQSVSVGAPRPIVAPQPRPMPRVGVTRLLSLGRRVASDAAALSPCLREAAHLLTHATAPQLLTKILPEGPALARLLQLVADIDHVGIVAPQRCNDGLGARMAAAGFDHRQWSFPSRILARELGELSGRDFVPTTVFKARGLSPKGRPMDVEVFMPRGDASAIRTWMRRGTGTHVAFSIAKRSMFDEITSLMKAQGFHLPAFMHDAPLKNEAERITAIYFDGQWTRRLPRLEFCHYR